MAQQPPTRARLGNEQLFDEAFLRKLERLAILTRKASAGQLQGERRSPKRGQSVEFADFRPYAPGDDFRRIDWNAYARLERFFIKLFVEEEDLTVHLLLDSSRSMAWGSPSKLAYAVRAAGALGYVGLVGLDRVTVTALREANGSGAVRQVADGHFPPHRGKRQALALFSFLQGVQARQENASGPRGNLPQGSFSPAALLRAYAAGAGLPGPLMLFSDLMDDGWMDGLRALVGRGFEITLVHILAPDEMDPDLEGDLKLLDSETDSAVEITADFDLLARYRQELADWREEWRAFCAPRGIHYVPISTAIPFEELLFAWLRKGGVLR